MLIGRGGTKKKAKALKGIKIIENKFFLFSISTQAQRDRPVSEAIWQPARRMPPISSKT